MDLQIAESFAYGKMWKNKILTLAEQDKISTVTGNHNFDLIVTGYNNGHWLSPYLKRKCMALDPWRPFRS